MGRNQSLQSEMQSHKTLIENTIGTPSIQDEVTLYSYTPEKMSEEKALFDATAALFTNQETETAEKEDATDDFNLLRDEIDDQFARDIKLARVALREDPTLLHSCLGIKGMRSSVYTEWKKQVKQFYSNALSNDDIKPKLAVLNISEESMNTQLSNLEELGKLFLDQKKETGKTQAATEARDKKLVEVERWSSDYKAVTRVVFEDRPQMLEILGVIVKS